MEQETRSDSELVTAACGGDTAAFGLLVDCYQEIVWAAAVSTSANPDLAEDITQETFVTAWRSLDSLRKPGRIRPWLVGIACNTARSTLRGRRREVLVDDVADRGHSSGPVEKAIANEETRAVWETLESIPEDYRVPLVLFYREEQSVKQVATDLGLTEVAVKKRLSRGREMVRSGMERELEAEARRSRPRRAMAPLVIAAIAALPAGEAAAASSGAALFAKGMTMKGLAKAAAVIAVLILLLAVGKSYLASADSEGTSAPGAEKAASQPLPPIDSRFTREAVAASATPDPRDGRLSGIVVNEEGSPVVGATVMFRIDTMHGSDTRHQPVGTDADGRFEITSLYRRTPVHVSATAVGYLPASHYGALPEGRELRLVLEKGGLELYGSVSDIGGGPIPGATVRYYHLSSGSIGSVDRPALATTTDDQGRYQVSLPPGRYFAAAAHPDYAGQLRSTALTREGLAEDFTLSPGATLEGVVRDQQSGDAVPYARVHASLLDDLGAETIAAYLVTGGQERDFAATADAGGRFRLSGLPASLFTLSASADHLVSARNQELTLGVAERRTGQTLWVQEGYRVSGRVVDAATGKPIPGASVSATSESNRGMSSGVPILSDASGEFVAYLPTGNFHMMAMARGYILKLDTPSVEVERSEIEGIELELSRGATLRGRIDPPEPGMLIATAGTGGAGLDFMTLISGLLAQGKVERDGSFELTGVPLGSMTLGTITMSGRRGLLELEVEGDESGLVIESELKGILRGTLVDDEGEPIAGASLRLTSKKERDLVGVSTMLADILGAVGRSDARGRFEIPAAKSVNFDIHVRDRNGQALELQSMEMRGEELLVVVERNRSEIRGKVLDASGSPVQDALVSSSELRTGALTDGEGDFVLTNLPAKDISLEVRDPATGESRSIPRAVVGEPLTIHLQAPASISVRVSGAPPGLSANIEAGELYTRELRESGAGRYEIDRLSPGTYRVELGNSQGYAAEQVKVRPGEQAQLRLEFKSWGRLRGRLLKADGTPAKRVFFSIDRETEGVVAESFESQYCLQAKLDAEGYFEVPVGQGPGTLSALGPAGLAEVPFEGKPHTVQDVGEIRLGTSVE